MQITIDREMTPIAKKQAMREACDSFKKWASSESFLLGAIVGYLEEKAPEDLPATGLGNAVISAVEIRPACFIGDSPALALVHMMTIDQYYMVYDFYIYLVQESPWKWEPELTPGIEGKRDSYIWGMTKYRREM